MLDKLNLYREEGQDASHNTLLTNKWLLIVPRSMALFSNIHINAFGFSGFISTDSFGDIQYQNLMKAGVNLELVIRNPPPLPLP